MAASANLVILIGNLTRNPEVKYTSTGQAVGTLNLAVNRRFKNNDTGEWQEKADFIKVSVWGKQAENCEKYLSKGRPVYIEGRLSLNQWEDANGDKRSRLEVVARNIQFLSSSQQSSYQDTESGQGSGKGTADVFDGDNDADEEIPF